MQRRKKSGIILDEAASIVLVASGEPDGLSRVDSLNWQQLRNEKPVVEAMLEDILASALCAGGIHLSVPHHIAEHFDISSLRGYMPIDIHESYRSPDFSRLSWHFERAWDSARRLEDDPRTSPLVSLDAPPAEASYQYGDETYYSSIDDLENCREALATRIAKVSELSPDLFAAFLDLSATWADFFDEEYAHVFSHDIREVDPQMPLQEIILDLMDLRVRDAEELDAERNSARYDLFPRDYFSDFQGFDRNWGPYGDIASVEGFIEHAVAGFFCSAVKIQMVHSFWRSLFLLRSLVELSASTSSPIWLASAPIPSQNYTTGSSNDTLVQLYRLYVQGVNSIPRVSSLQDLVRLLNDRHVRRFREQLSHWEASVFLGEANVLTRMQRDFELACDDMRKISSMRKASALVSLVALPVRIAGLLTGLPLDFAFTALGPALLGYSWLKKRNIAWALLGGPEAFSSTLAGRAKRGTADPE